MSTELKTVAWRMEWPGRLPSLVDDATGYLPGLRNYLQPLVLRSEAEAEIAQLREALKDLLYANHARPSCQEGASHITRCRCVSCATERASAAIN